MKRKSGLTSAILVALTVVAAASLAGCGKGGQQAQAGATPANLTMASSAATAALPPSGEAPPNTQAAPNRAAPDRATAAAQPQFARVVAVQPITRTSTTSTPRRVCQNEQVAVPETYKDSHQIGGAVAGGLIGALAGHMIGGGKGKTLATVAGAAGGAFAGHEIQKKHQEDNATTTQTENVCHTVNDKSSKTTTVGYDVTYTLDGKAGHVRMDHNPGVGNGLPVENGVVVAGGNSGSGNY